MLNRIKAWLEGTAAAAKQAPGLDERRLAAAALLVEAAHLDGRYGEPERRRICALLAANFSLTAEEAETLADAGESEQARAVDLFRFTRNAASTLGETERVGLIEMLWEVVYADGEEHPYESNLVRRVTGLLHLSDVESGAARRRVLDRLKHKD